VHALRVGPGHTHTYTHTFSLSHKCVLSLPAGPGASRRAGEQGKVGASASEAPPRGAEQARRTGAALVRHTQTAALILQAAEAEPRMLAAWGHSLVALARRLAAWGHSTPVRVGGMREPSGSTLAA
jgi:hypothetical protein